MIEITQQEFEKNFEDYCDRVEKNKEVFLIRSEDGKAFVMAPIEQIEGESDGTQI